MNILITGAYGFVGTNLCNYLTAKGHSCSALDVRQGDVPYSAFYDWNQLAKIPWERFDAVVHLAGKAHDTHNTSEAQSYFDINTGLTQKVFLACRNRVKRFLFFSSVKACADSVVGALTENAPCNPKTPYGQSKLAAETWLKDVTRKNTESTKNNQDSVEMNQPTSLYILRPAMIHGPGNKGNLNLLYKIARYGFPWPLGAFENSRSFSSIANVCAVVEALCSGKAEQGIYQMADDETVSVNRLIELIAESLGKKTRILKVPHGIIQFGAKMGDIFHLPLNSERLNKLTESYVVSNAKLKEALGWSAMPIRAEAGLRKTIESFRKV